jgi:hypothetical protein
MMMTRASMGAMDAAAVDEVVRRLVEGGRGGRQVQLSEAEIRQLCVEAKQVLLSQPNLLRIHAPVKICGGWASFRAPHLCYACACSHFGRRVLFNPGRILIAAVRLGWWISDCCGSGESVHVPCSLAAVMGNCCFLDSSSLIDSRSAGIR